MNPDRARRRRRRSSISRRILAINFIALLVPVVGLLYLGQYRDSLIQSEIESLATQAEVLAAAVAENSAAGASDGAALLTPGAAASVVRRIAQVTGARARLFAPDGEVVADSWLLLRPGGAVQSEELPPPPGGTGTLARALRVFDRLVDWLPGRDEFLPLYREGPDADADDFDEAIQALAGRAATAVRRAPSGGVVMSAAAPVQYYKQVLGAVMVTRGSQNVDDAVFQVRGRILTLWMVALGFTVAMSLFLAQTIARPLARLAEAAEHIRRGPRRGERLPDFSGRRDEIADLAQSLHAMTEGLMQRIEATERFAADVAHEIKNPLTSVRSAAETAVRIQDPERRARLLQIVLDDVARLERLINDISDASRLDAELSRVRFQAVPLVALLRSAAETLAATRQPGTPAVVLETGEADDGLAVSGLEDRLVQVFRNLIANALSFSPADGTVRLFVGREGNEAVIRVDDDGPGIPVGKEEAVFERFYSERPTGEAFGIHSGLGLSISRQIVEAHGGTIRAMSRHDAEDGARGCRIEVRLPLMAR